MVAIAEEKFKSKGSFKGNKEIFWATVDLCFHLLGLRPVARGTRKKVRRCLSRCCDVMEALCCPPCPDSVIYKSAFT